MNMQRDNAFFQFLRAILFSDEAVECEDWDEVFEEMKSQSVAALAGDWLKRHSVPVSKEWRSYCYRQKTNWVKVLHAQSELLDLLRENGIPCVILKGAAAAMYYPKPYLRTMGDVDLLVKRSDHDRAAAIMEENGYKLKQEKDPLCHHYGYSKDGIIFELHRRLGIVQETDESLICNKKFIL